MNVTYVATNWDRLTPKLEEAIVDTLYMVVSTLIIAGIIGLGLGVLLYTTRSRGILSNKGLYSLLNVVVNLIRPIPFIILLAALGPVTRGVVGTTIGTNAAMFVMIVAASFGIARIVEQNLVSIDPGVIEAARAMGASPWQIVRTVIIPEALGPLVLGYTFAFIAVLAHLAIVVQERCRKNFIPVTFLESVIRSAQFHCRLCHTNRVLTQTAGMVGMVLNACRLFKEP